jgi:hypothetical protein
MPLLSEQYRLNEKINEAQLAIGNQISQIESNHNSIKELETFNETLKKNLEKTKETMYIMEQQRLHVNEIVRLAEIHLPRLRGATNNELIESDVTELSKWISRVKTMDGYLSIINAFKRMETYRPKDVKNPYALIQKIIIEGPIKKKS